jgi:hypothetical protein
VLCLFNLDAALGESVDATSQILSRYLATMPGSAGTFGDAHLMASKSVSLTRSHDLLHKMTELLLI